MEILYTTNSRIFKEFRVYIGHRVVDTFSFLVFSATPIAGHLPCI